MKAPIKTIFLFCLSALALAAAPPAAHAQLRLISPYPYDRINQPGTGFTLQEGGGAEFAWSSEWTQLTAQSCMDEVAVFVWRFKDGTKAYSRAGEFIADFGRSMTYLQEQKAAGLEDVNHKPIQPLTKDNPPVRVELWAGDGGVTDRFDTQGLLDYACFDTSAGVEVGKGYTATDCPE
ncbi:MAG: hypothetical protein LBT74_06405 [Acidobacteriota bacterium]|jgi:hypothetical protein|nr:hypothetical protein [Acidobacteriota bacterium]